MYLLAQGIRNRYFRLVFRQRQSSEGLPGFVVCRYFYRRESEGVDRRFLPVYFPV
jgi:hypothetical protein